MRLLLDRTLFDAESTTDEALALIDIFSTAARDAYSLHALLINPSYIPGGNNGSLDVWLNNRSPREKQAFRKILDVGLLVNAARPIGGGASDSQDPRRWHLEGPSTIRVERRPASDWKGRTLTISDAADLLREPVHLVLENERTDLAFVCMLAGPTDGKTLRELVDQPGKIRVHGGGGGEAKKWLGALSEPSPTAATWRKLLRTWVLFDKDADSLDATEPSRSAKDLMALCKDLTTMHGQCLSWVCLLRREAESYVPKEGLEKEATAERLDFVRHVAAWRENLLFAPWAWALDLKKGLRGDLLPLPKDDLWNLKEKKIPLEAHMLKSPFTQLSAQDISILEYGFGDRLGKAFLVIPPPDWASKVSAEYDRGPVEQAPRDLFVQSIFDRI